MVKKKFTPTDEFNEELEDSFVTKDGCDPQRFLLAVRDSFSGGEEFLTSNYYNLHPVFECGYGRGSGDYCGMGDCTGGNYVE